MQSFLPLLYLARDWRDYLVVMSICWDSFWVCSTHPDSVALAVLKKVLFIIMQDEIIHVQNDFLAFTTPRVTSKGEAQQIGY